jgi:pimeloyl-ACP methyl ester carboxylesterase
MDGAERTVVQREEGDVEIWVTRTRAAHAAAPEAVVLAFCGNADRAERLAARVARRLGDRPVEIWSVNYPGFGGSEGSARLGAIPDAALAAYDAAAAREPPLPVLCWGESIGTAAALHVASQRDVEGLVLHNPPPLKRLIMVRHGWWNLWLVAIPVALQVPSELNSLDTAPLVDAPAVFVMAQGDSVVPYDYQRLVFEAYAGPKSDVPIAGGHNSGIDAHGDLKLRIALDALLADVLPGRREPPR